MTDTTKQIACIECDKHLQVNVEEDNYQVCDTCLHEHPAYVNTNHQDEVCFMCHESVSKFTGHQIHGSPCYCHECY